MLTNLQELFKEAAVSALQSEVAPEIPSLHAAAAQSPGSGTEDDCADLECPQSLDIDGVEKLAREGKIRILPRMGEKHEHKLIKAMEDYRRIGGRFQISTAED